MLKHGVGYTVVEGSVLKIVGGAGWRLGLILQGSESAIYSAVAGLLAVRPVSCVGGFGRIAWYKDMKAVQL